MITEKTIRNEAVMHLRDRFREWLEDVRLNAVERRQIEDIISELQALVDF